MTECAWNDEAMDKFVFIRLLDDGCHDDGCGLDHPKATKEHEERHPSVHRSGETVRKSVTKTRLLPVFCRLELLGKCKKERTAGRCPFLLLYTILHETKHFVSALSD